MKINKSEKIIKKKNRKKTLKKKGGVQPPSTPERPRLTRAPPPPPLPGTPTVVTGEQFPSMNLSIGWDTATSALQEISNRNSGEYLYQNSEDYINAAFNIITDIVTVQNIINDVRPDNLDFLLLDKLFTDYILPNFTFAINNNIEHWNTISRHLTTGRTGTIIDFLSVQSGRYPPRQGYSTPYEIYRNHIIDIARLNPNQMNIVDGGMQRKPRKTKKKILKKKGGGTEEIRTFLNHIVNNTYPEDVVPDDNVLFGYKKDDLKHIKELHLIGEDDLEAIANAVAERIDVEHEIAQKKINRLHKFKLHILEVLHHYNMDIEHTTFPNYTTRTVNFSTPPQENTRREPNPPSFMRNRRTPISSLELRLP